ncbi:MAG: hypothetical protein KAT17_06385, partial [Candidatus Aminicenantes bacterium]|nr:hypothetical protein [Candidatus Aminicenantes bacterium]
FPILPSLIITLVCDRMVVLGLVMVIARLLELPEGILGIASVLRGIPGVIALLVVIPPLVKRFSLHKKQMTLME